MAPNITVDVVVRLDRALAHRAVRSTRPMCWDQPAGRVKSAMDGGADLARVKHDPLMSACVGPLLAGEAIGKHTKPQHPGREPVDRTHAWGPGSAA